MSFRTKMSAVPFAHLLGLAARAEDDEEDRKAKRAEDEDDDKKSRRAEEDDGDDKDDKDEGKKGKKAKRADDGDDGDDAKSSRAEDDKDDEDEGKKGKKAKRAEDDDDDDDDDEMKGNSASAKARQRERARCSAIFASPAAAGLPHVAANLAFNTNMSRQEAITVLKSVAASQPKPILGVTRGTLSERMANNPVPNVGLDGGRSAPSNMSPVAAAIVAAGEKARGGK